MKERSKDKTVATIALSLLEKNINVKTEKIVPTKTSRYVENRDAPIFDPANIKKGYNTQVISKPKYGKKSLPGINPLLILYSPLAVW